jgi:hypothetical protein
MFMTKRYYVYVSQFFLGALFALAFVIEESYGLKAAWMIIMINYALVMTLLGCCGSIF